MKIVEPSVELLGLSMPVLYAPETEKLHVSSYIPEKLIERAGRVCYKSEDKIDIESYKPFVEKVCNQLHHESVMEHSLATFLVICDRGISHEIVRHRIGSYSQESTRYCNYGKEKFGREISVIQPPGLEGRALDCWKHSCLVAEENYFDLLDEGHSPQIARSVLPTCLKTEIVISYNFREWKHFLKMRTSEAAHPQIRSLATNIHSLLKKVAPTIFEV